MILRSFAAWLHDELPFQKQRSCSAAALASPSRLHDNTRGLILQRSKGFALAPAFDTFQSNIADDLKRATVTSVDHSDLLHGVDVTEQLEQAFGPNGLGIITVSGIDELKEKRLVLLSLAHRFAALPDDVKARYEDPKSLYNFGWSHGKEALKAGQPDVYKGSFYANPLTDMPCTDKHLVEKYPAYFHPNIWPSDHLPQLEPAFKDLGGLIVAVGLLLMQQCDRYCAERWPGMSAHKLWRVLERSRNPKARLLYYFPPSPSAAGGPEQAWCAWHTDHGSLTGLTSALYTKDGVVVPNLDPKAGLYIRTRHGEVVQAIIPPDHLAFQVGEALQIHSGGVFRATPHYVRAASGPSTAGIGRSTFAVFMQPDVLEPMDVPPGASAQQVAVGQWQSNMDFGAFSEATFHNYYK